MIWLADIYVNFDFDEISLPPAYSHYHLISFLPFYSPRRDHLWPQFTTIPEVFNNTPPPPLSWLSSPAGKASVTTMMIRQQPPPPLPPLLCHTQRQQRSQPTACHHTMTMTTAATQPHQHRCWRRRKAIDYKSGFNSQCQVASLLY